MKIINPGYEILTDINGGKILKDIELAARTCYKSEDKIGRGSAEELVRILLKRGHEAMIEFGDIAVKFVCNRGFTHEMVRMRLCSFAQESTRYCNYGKDGEITFIRPPFLLESNELDQCFRVWKGAMREAEMNYLKLIKLGCSPQEARGVLPIDVKTEIVVKTNIREWRHIFKLRTARAAHPSMQQLMRPLCEELKDKIPLVFDDIIW